MNKIQQIISEYAIPLLLAGIFLAVIGARIFLTMPRGIFPEVNFPRVIVEVNMSYAPLEQMEWGITSLLEREFRTVPGVRIVKSTSSRGTSIINVFLNADEDVNLALNRVNTKLGEVRGLIPPSAQLRVRPITASAFTGAEYCFSSKELNSTDLRYFVDYIIRPRILALPGIFNVLVLGGDLPEFTINIDPNKLSYYNLTIEDINDRVKNSNVMDFIGAVRYGNDEILGFGGKLLKKTGDIDNTVVYSSFGTSVKIKDIGNTALGQSWKFKDLSLMGSECVALDIFYQQGINQSETSAGVRDAIAEILSETKSKISFKSWDLNDFTENATSAVLLDLFMGMLIIGFITYIFLKDLKFTFIALVAMPLTACLTFLVMKMQGMTLNLMTLGGLAAAIGLVVDNTVIFLEMYHRVRMDNPTLKTRVIIEQVLGNISRPMIWGTTAIALVFTPIGMLSGLAGMFFEPMARVHGISLILSVFVAILLIPGFLIVLTSLDGHKLQKAAQELKPAKSAYMHILQKIFLKPVRNSFLFMLIPLLAILLLPFARSGFLPVWDEGDLVIDYRARSPLSLENTVAKLISLEKKLKEIPEIDFYIRKTGTSLGSFNKVPYMGEIIVKLKEKRNKSVFELISDIEKISAEIAPDFEYDFFQILPDRLNDLTGSGKPVVVYIRSNDEKKSEDAANRFKSLIEKIPGLDSVRQEEPAKAKELIFSVDEHFSRAVELNPSVIIQSVRAGIFSVDSSLIQSGPQTIPVRLKLKRNRIPQTTEIASLPVYTLKGGLKKLSSLGNLEVKESRVESNHIDGDPVKIITAQLDGKSDLGSVINRIKESLAVNQQEGIYTELAGDYTVQQQSFQELIMAFISGIAIIFMISLFYTNHFVTAWMITLIATIPPAFGLIGLVLVNIPVDVSSFSGLISVTGVAVANMFMAIAAILVNFQTGLSLEKNIIDGMISRLRPILMTNLAGMAGFIPIAMGVARGDEILHPFSIAILFGLTGSMATTLFVMPLFLKTYCGKLFYRYN